MTPTDSVAVAIFVATVIGITVHKLCAPVCPRAYADDNIRIVMLLMRTQEVNFAAAGKCSCCGLISTRLINIGCVSYLGSAHF
jgi:hypothetical protein